MSGERAETDVQSILEAVEAEMAEAGDTAEEQEAAVEEQSDDTGDPDEDEDQAADTAEEEGSGESGEAEEAESATDDEGLSWQEILPKVKNWDGFDQAKLEDLPPHLASQRQYLSRLATEYQNKLRELEQRGQAKPAEQPAPAEEPDPEPPMPSFDDDQQAFLAKMQAREQWLKREAAREAEQRFKPYIERIEKTEQTFQQQQRAQLQKDIEGRVKYMQSIPGWSPEVQQQIDVLVDAHPEMAGMAWDDEGASYLVRMARLQVDERNSKAQAADRVATAPSRSVKPPSPRGTVKKTEKKIGSGAKTMHDIANQVAELDEFRGLFKD